MQFQQKKTCPRNKKKTLTFLPFHMRSTYEMLNKAGYTAKSRASDIKG